MKSDDGSISYLQYEFNMPQVTSADNPEAAEQINSYFVQRQEELMADCNEYYEWAKRIIRSEWMSRRKTERKDRRKIPLAIIVVVITR